MTALILLSPSSLRTAQRLRNALPGAVLHGLCGRVAAQDVDVSFKNTPTHIANLFAGNTPIIGFCATGILIRAVAPYLHNKHMEPPVLAVAEDGRSIIPLLGGHHGANQLAQRVAEVLGGRAALTTASEVRLGFALDNPPSGWTLANPEQVKSVTAALLAEKPVALHRDAGNGCWPPPEVFSTTATDSPAVVVTDRADRKGEGRLVLHPPVLAVGAGCERGATPEGLLSLVQKILQESNLAVEAIAALGSLDLKVDESALQHLARALNKPFRVFGAERLAQEEPRLLNPSETVRREVGCPSVAEAAALALAGPEAELIVPKRSANGCTVAVARSPAPIDPTDKGRPPGRLFVVGLGPGSRDWRTVEALTALRQAEVIVGYQLYLDLVADVIRGRETHNTPLGEEENRVRMALDRAAQGRTVALVCSGDPGIYALATLVFELVERTDRRDWNGVNITIVPGLSALQAAAARVGAPLGHDFCAVSLSDLLTPRDVILKRLESAAKGDFVTTLYNPQSQRRRTLLPEAHKLFLSHRPAETPVIVARALGRVEEGVRVTPLAAFDPMRVDMLSLVVIGNSTTRAFTHNGRTHVYTPRGYGL